MYSVSKRQYIFPVHKQKNHQLHIWAAHLTLPCQSLRRCWRGDGFVALTTNPTRPAGPFTITDALTDNTGPKPDTEVYLVWVYQLSHCCLLIISSLELRRPPLKALPECNWINAQGVQHRETSSWHIAVQSSSEQPMKHETNRSNRLCDTINPHPVRLTVLIYDVPSWCRVRVAAPGGFAPFFHG